jgi:hypothetical protein
MSLTHARRDLTPVEWLLVVTAALALFAAAAGTAFGGDPPTSPQPTPLTRPEMR